jgi:hypothetical protein
LKIENEKLHADLSDMKDLYMQMRVNGIQENTMSELAVYMRLKAKIAMQQSLAFLNKNSEMI